MSTSYETGKVMSFSISQIMVSGAKFYQYLVVFEIEATNNPKTDELCTILCNAPVFAIGYYINRPSADCVTKLRSV